MRTFAYLGVQPIALAELNYQRRSNPPQRRWIRWIRRAGITFAYLLSSIALGSEIAIALLIRVDQATSINLILLFDMLGALPLVAFIIVLAIHFGLMVQTLTLATNSIARERQTNNWEMLILTGMDARKIVRGKWWATVLRMWRSYGRLALLRAMLIG
jgi:hypothetical protein